MGTRERRQDRGRLRADRCSRDTGQDIRRTRRGAGVSLRVAGAAVGLSHSTFCRIERGELPNVTVRELSLACAAVGLELSIRAYPDADPIRDAAHAALLERVRLLLPSGAVWRTEVPLPIAGDRRALDAVTVLERARVVFEAETRLGDMQDVGRKLELKRRDGRVEILVLVVADTRHNRVVLAAHRKALRGAFPLDSREIRAALAAGRAPRASGILVV
ncbi:MAG TPA: helix-turn-helix transcriptional regulator [Candidatus Limnocylindrales bacterium]